ncbi:EpsG family protein [Pseudomonas sp. TNT3]|uniref:EpsG family protein n=1 Tax=Pseudomonas sp. TNT3 TaxID=2654097 RepID=UPI0013912996|nr:EpsG family protein [Pseudomonas sp. TNT3]KAI2694271.1 EpsG family protein [Pseudomonas sp. TNT3]
MSIFLWTAMGAGFSFVNDSRALKIFGFIVFCFLTVYLVFFAGLRAPDIAPDYFNYVEWLHRAGKSIDTIAAEFKDPGFLLLFSVVHWLGLPDFAFFCVVAGISILAKSVFSKEVLSGYFSYFIFFLIFSRFFIVHDLVQVRVGVAIALASCALMFFYKGQSLKGLLLFCFGLSFHLSVIMFFPVFILLMSGFKGFSRGLILSIIIASFALSSLISGLSGWLGGFSRLAPYLNGEYQTSALSLLSFYFLIRLSIISFILLAFYQVLSDVERFVLSISVIGLALQILFSWNDSLSLRTAELFGFFDMVTFVMLMRFFDCKSKIVYGVFLFAIAGAFYASSLKIIDAYASVLS